MGIPFKVILRIEELVLGNLGIAESIAIKGTFTLAVAMVLKLCPLTETDSNTGSARLPFRFLPLDLAGNVGFDFSGFVHGSKGI